MLLTYYYYLLPINIRLLSINSSTRAKAQCRNDESINVVMNERRNSATLTLSSEGHDETLSLLVMVRCLGQAVDVRQGAHRGQDSTRG